MLEALKALVTKDDDLPPRAWMHDWRTRFLDGSIYNVLKYEFREEKNDANGEYIPLHQRRPSVRFLLPAIIVNDSVSMVFSEGHFPNVEAGDDDIEKALTDFNKQARLKTLMAEAAHWGSVGSVALWLRIIKEKPYVSVLKTRFLTPTWKKDAPDELGRVREKYKTKGKALIALGYAIPKKMADEEFWFQRDWTDAEEVWYRPWPVDADKWRALAAGQPAPPPEVKDIARTVAHGMGFVPIVWIRNLPLGDETDGACTFEGALHNAIEIDYQLSQQGRGLRYSMDPTLHIQDEAYTDTDAKQLVKGAANALVTGPNTNASLLEISGAAYAHVLDYAKAIRELALENCSGNRSSPERMMAAQSGRALEIMNQALIWLADKLRTSYGEEGLLPLYRMLLRANEKVPLRLGKKKYPAGALSPFLDHEQLELNLKWPDWYPPTPADRAQNASALATHRTAGIISRETAVKAIQHEMDIDDPDKEIERIKAEALERADIEAEVARKTRPFEYPPSRQAAE